MACSGCARRRKKAVALLNAMKAGLATAKQSYIANTTDHRAMQRVLNRKEIPPNVRVIDIRETAE